MAALVVVEIKVFSQSSLNLTDAAVVTQINIFVFDRPPQPLGKDVVHAPPASVHADVNRGVSGQETGIPRTGKMATLV